MKANSSTPNLLKPLKRGIPIIVGVVILCVLVARKYLKYATPQFESTAKIKLADSKDGIPNSNLYKNFDVFATNNKIGTEVELLKSDALVGKVFDRLNLSVTVFRVGEIHKTELYDVSPIIIVPVSTGKKDWDMRYKLVISDRRRLVITTPEGAVINGVIGTEIKTKTSSFIIKHNDALLAVKPGLRVDDNYEFIINSKQSQVSTIAGNLDVLSVDKDIPILRVSYKCPVAQKSADIVNTIAQAYIEDYIHEKFSSADTTENFLANQLKEYGDKLAASETDIRDYRDGKNIVNIRQETETDLRKVADLKKQLASVQMNLEAIDSLNLYIKKGKDNFADLAPNFEAFTDLLSTEMVKDIKHLQAEKRDLLTRYTPANEKVIVVDRKIGDLTNYLQESIKNTQTDLRIKYNNLKQTIQQCEAEFVGLPEKEKHMTILERNFGMNEQIYRFLESKRTEARIAKTATISFHRIIARGEVPEMPVSPNKKLIIVFSAFLGFMFSIVGIYGYHSVKARVDNENIIYRNSDTPLDFSLPFAGSDAERSRAFNKWVLELELKKQLPQSTVLCISSANKNEGKQFIATGLADGIAALGKSTLLVKMNGKVDGLPPMKCGVFSPHQVSAQWQIPSIWDQILENWKDKYDVVVIENTAINKENSSIIAMAGANINFVIVDSRLTKVSELENTDELKERLGITGMRFVLNRAGYMPSLFLKIKHLRNKIKNAKKNTE